MQHEPEMLRDYLVAGVEDPRVNVQSILTRHYLTVSLFGHRFEKLMDHELRFATVMNWAGEVFSQAGGAEDLAAIRYALAQGADNAEGLPIPTFISAAFRSVSTDAERAIVPNYFDPLLAPPADGEPKVRPDVLETFARVWREALRGESPSHARVLEPACGSANDYRFLEAYGLARLVDYTGFDLCVKNVDNARGLFPNTRFLVGNAFAMSFANGAFDHALVHDLFEHLSIEAMEKALAELGRVARRGLCLGFFNLHEGEEHIVQPTDDYHWNRLSLPRLRQALDAHGFQVQVVHIDTFLRWRFGCDQTHNKNAYTLFAERKG